MVSQAPDYVVPDHPLAADLGGRAGSVGLALGNSALATNFTDTATIRRDLDRLRTSPSLLPALRDAGRANAARYPLSTTADALLDLGKQLC